MKNKRIVFYTISRCCIESSFFKRFKRYFTGGKELKFVFRITGIVRKKKHRVRSDRRIAIPGSWKKILFYVLGKEIMRKAAKQQKYKERSLHYFFRHWVISPKVILILPI